MAMKLLSLTVGVASASSSRSPMSQSQGPLSSLSLSSSSSSSNNDRRILDVVSSSSTSTSTTPMRTLQDSNGNSYAYLDDLSGRSLQYGNCLRVKIPQENDDDAVEGNVNFYDGAYRAQQAVYVTFHVCGDGSGSDQCYDCDYGVEYAAPVGDYLDAALDHWEGYCDDCQDACGNRRRRLDEGYQVDCDTCSDTCATFNSYGDDDALDETNYLDCEEAYANDDGLQLYYGPQCGEDGSLAIGVFYDDECTIKTKEDGPNNLGYAKFDAIANGCVDCDEQNGQGTCGDMYEDAYHCVNGRDMTGRDEAGVCSAVRKAFAVIDYSNVRKRRSGADGFLKVVFGVLAMSAVGGFFFLSYTYYVRHRGERGQPMLSSEDVHEGGEGGVGGKGSPPANATLT